MCRVLRSGLIILVAWFAFVFLNNTNLLATRAPGQPVLLAHRGIAQRFDTRDLRGDTCTAARMLTPEHAFLENTIASMRAVFEAGSTCIRPPTASLPSSTIGRSIAGLTAPASPASAPWLN